MTDKQSLVFACSFVAATSSLLGWLCVNRNLNWWLGVPIIIFIAIVAGYIMTEAIDRNRDDR